MKTRKVSSGAFTLIEILASMAIVAVLAALLFPAIRKMTEKAREAKCLSNLRQLGSAWLAYANDNGGRLASTGWKNASNNALNPGIRDYVGLPMVVGSANWQRETAFTCPVLQANPATATQEVFFRTYSVNQLAADLYNSDAPPAGLKRRLSAINRPSQFAVAMDGLYDASRPINDRYSQMVRNFGGTVQADIQRPHREMANVLFADGRVAATPKEVILDTSATSVFWRDPAN